MRRNLFADLPRQVQHELGASARLPLPAQSLIAVVKAHQRRRHLRMTSPWCCLIMSCCLPIEVCLHGATPLHPIPRFQPVALIVILSKSGRRYKSHVAGRGTQATGCGTTWDAGRGLRDSRPRSARGPRAGRGTRIEAAGCGPRAAGHRPGAAEARGRTKITRLWFPTSTTITTTTTAAAATTATTTITATACCVCCCYTCMLIQLYKSHFICQPKSELDTCKCWKACILLLLLLPQLLLLRLPIVLLPLHKCSAATTTAAAATKVVKSATTTVATAMAAATAAPPPPPPQAQLLPLLRF